MLSTKREREVIAQQDEESGTTTTYWPKTCEHVLNEARSRLTGIGWYRDATDLLSQDNVVEFPLQ